MNQISRARYAVLDAREELESTPRIHPVWAVRAARLRALQEDLYCLIDAESDGGTRPIPKHRR